MLLVDSGRTAPQSALGLSLCMYTEQMQHEARMILSECPRGGLGNAHGDCQSSKVDEDPKKQSYRTQGEAGTRKYRRKKSTSAVRGFRLRWSVDQLAILLLCACAVRRLGLALVAAQAARQDESRVDNDRGNLYKLLLHCGICTMAIIRYM